MSELNYIANNNDLRVWCRQNCPHKIGEWDKITSWTKEVGQKLLLSDKFKKIIDFKANIFICNHIHNIHEYLDHENKLNDDKLCIYYIYHDISYNNLRYTDEYSQSLIKCYHYFKNKRVFVLGSSKDMLNETRFAKYTEDDIIVRFNAACLHHERTDILVANNVMINKYFDIYKKKCDILLCPQSSLNNRVIHIKTFMEKCDFCRTTGLLFLNWLICNFKNHYKGVFIAGFDMKNGGELQHYFNKERVPMKSERFPGHNATYEKDYIKNILSNTENKLCLIKDM